MSRRSPLPRSHSRASGCSLQSATTYHSFQDIDIYEPPSTEDGTPMITNRYVDEPLEYLSTPPLRSSRRGSRDKHPSSIQMARQDSGYESSTPPRSSQSSRRRDPSILSSSSSPQATSSNSIRNTGPRKRPSARRAATTGANSTPISHLPRSSLHITSQRRQSHPKFYQFPAPEQIEGQERESIDLNPIIIRVNTTYQAPQFTELPPVESPSDSPTFPVPQTTHYWTSDRTRRLEYAAIDAASRGIRGWVMRHVVPECLVPNEKRRIGFEDDGGSVRRYRLELQEMECVDLPSRSAPALEPPIVEVDPEKDEDNSSCLRVPARKKRRSLWALLKGKW